MKGPLRLFSVDRLSQDESASFFVCFSKKVFRKKWELVHSTPHTHTHTELYTEERRNVRRPLWEHSDHWKQIWALTELSWHGKKGSSLAQRMM